MTVEATFTGPKVRMPTPGTMFGEIDNELRGKAAVTRDRVVATMRSQIPHRSGRTAAATTARVKNSERGFAIEISNRSSAHHLRFLQTGTGIYGPRRRKIPRAKRGFIPSAGIQPTGKGMRSQNTLRKMLKAVWDRDMPTATREMRQAWEEACRRVYGGGGR